MQEVEESRRCSGARRGERRRIDCRRFGTSASTTMIPPELLLQGYRLGILPVALEDDSLELVFPERRWLTPLVTLSLPHAARRPLAAQAIEGKIASTVS